MALGQFAPTVAVLGDHPVRDLILLSLIAVLGYPIFRYLTAWRALGRAYALHDCERPAAYPHTDPLFGFDALLANIAAARDHRFTAAESQRFQDIGADTYYTWIQGRQTVVTRDPDIVRCILGTNSKDYSIGGRRALFGRFLGNGIFVSEGEEWVRSRARLRRNFSKEQVADLAMLERHVAKLFQVLPGDNQLNAVVDLQDCFLRFTTDSSSEFLFGHSTNTLVRPSARDVAFGEAFTLSLDLITQKMRRGPLKRFYPKDPREDSACQIVRDYVGDFVEEAVAFREKKTADGEVLEGPEDAGPEQRYLILRELVRAIDDKERICDELISLITAGRDTTASLLSSTFHVLSRRPDIWRKLRNEIQHLDGHPPDYEQLRNLKFVKYIINETLRLYPPVFRNARVAVRDTILPTGGGPDGTSPVFVPKDTSVVFSVWAMHRRTDLYGPDATEFNPERWATQRHGWDYVPFGGGPRICLGQQYALTEAMYIMVRMAQQYASLETADDTPWTEHICLTLAIKDGVKCKLTRA
ncbi:hypothetical protein NHJ13734_005909 [Beauveria thailandica]